MKRKKENTTMSVLFIHSYTYFLFILYIIIHIYTRLYISSKKSIKLIKPNPFLLRIDFFLISKFELVEKSNVIAKVLYVIGSIILYSAYIWR